MTRRILNVVAVGSASGAYGGPWSTSLRQVRTAVDAGFDARLLAGYLEGDAANVPADLRTRSTMIPVRRIGRTHSFASVFSLRFAWAATKEVRHAELVHVSMGRELISAWCVLLCSLFRR